MLMMLMKTMSAILLSIIMMLAFAIIIEQSAKADNFICFSKEICISTTGYGHGIYRSTYNGRLTWIKIDCDKHTVSTLVDGEQNPAVGDIKPDSIANMLYERSCPTEM